MKEPNQRRTLAEMKESNQRRTLAVMKEPSPLRTLAEMKEPNQRRRLPLKLQKYRFATNSRVNNFDPISLAGNQSHSEKE